MKEKDSKLLDELMELVGYKHSDLFRQKSAQLSRVFESITQERDSIAELGPGVSPKSLFALSSIDFKGYLSVIDINSKALWAQTFVYEKLKPEFILNTIHEDLYVSDLQNYDLVLCNHLIDDLVAEDFAQKNNINYQSGVFNNPEKQQLFWSQISLADGLNTARKFGLKLAEIDTGCKIVLNHYEANFDRIHQITNRDLVISQVFRHLEWLLYNHGFKQLTIPDFNSTQDEYWLISIKI